jgi:hypothetical protein
MRKLTDEEIKKIEVIELIANTSFGSDANDGYYLEEFLANLNLPTLITILGELQLKDLQKQDNIARHIERNKDTISKIEQEILDIDWENNELK